MRVLHVIPDLSPRSGGPVTAVVGMAKALTRIGVETVVMTTDYEFERAGLDQGFEILPFPCINARWRWSPQLADTLDATAGRWDVVHVHTMWTYPTAAAARVCRRRSIPLVLRPCGMLQEWSVRQKALKKKVYWRLFEARSVSTATAVHFTSGLERLESSSLTKNIPSFVLPLGVDIDEPDGVSGCLDDDVTKLENSAHRPLVVTVGRLHPKKRAELVIKAFADVVRAVPGALLAFAGDGDTQYVRRLEALTRDLGLADDVRFLGHLGRRSIAKVLSMARVSVTPSLQENFSIAVAEAMASACPVIVTRQVALSDAIERERAGLVVDETPESIAAAIVAVLRDPVVGGAYGGRGREYARRELSWTTIAPRLMHLYDDILSGGLTSTAWCHETVTAR